MSFRRSLRPAGADEIRRDRGGAGPRGRTHFVASIIPRCRINIFNSALPMPDVGQHSPHNEVPADGHAHDDGRDSGGTQPVGPEALDEALRHASEAREYFGHWLAAEADRLKL